MYQADFPKSEITIDRHTCQLKVNHTNAIRSQFDIVVQ